MSVLTSLDNYIRVHKSVQAFLFVSVFFSLLNISYTVMVVAVVRSWLLIWWVDRRFPLCLIPLWAFLLTSIVLLVLGIYYHPRNRPKLHFDRINQLLISIVVGIIVWILIALSLTHTLYVGDFNVFQIMENAFSGRNLLELPVETIDVFPTLGDTVLIGYVMSFLFSFLISWRALRKTVPKRYVFFENQFLIDNF